MEFDLYWLDGKHEVIEGADIKSAFTAAGYGNGAVKALDFYTTSKETYIWNKNTRQWLPQIECPKCKKISNNKFRCTVCSEWIYS